VLGIRWDKENVVYPSHKCLLIGTWTHAELTAAIQRGYKIKHIAYSHIWGNTNNPLSDMIDNLYTLKRDAKDELEKHFIKIILNGGMGKLCQKRIQYEYEWDSVENHLERTSQTWEAVDLYDTDRLYRKNTGINYPKFYCPIIYAYITAMARLRLLTDMEKIPKDKLYYVDTDCIIADTSAIEKAKFKYGKELGLYKKVDEKQNILIYGKKAYMIGDNIKLSGIGKSWITKELFIKGKIQYKRMLTERNCTQKELIGTFQDIHHDLTTTTMETLQLQEKVKNSPMIRDEKANLLLFEGVL